MTATGRHLLFPLAWRYIQGGPFEVTKILAVDPQYMEMPNSPFGFAACAGSLGELSLVYHVTRRKAV